MASDEDVGEVDAMTSTPMGSAVASCEGDGDDEGRSDEGPAPHGTQVGEGGVDAADPLRSGPRLVRMIEYAREQRGSPSLWDAVAVRLDAEERMREVVAPMLRLLDQIHERVDDETWRLIRDFEERCIQEIMAGVEVGLELGYDHGRATALVDTNRGSGSAANILTERFIDLVGDTDAEYLDVLLALLTTLRATVMMAHGKRRALDSDGPQPSPE